jgi:imidazolonepropionase-like amidohydrolase
MGLSKIILSVVFIITIAVNINSKNIVTVAIINGNLINPIDTKATENITVLIQEDKIIKVGRTSEIPIPKHAKVINASGKWIIPGLIDSHVHFFQSGGLYTRPDVLDLRKYRSYDVEVSKIKRDVIDTLSRFIRSGVTSVIDVGGPFWNFQVRDIANKIELAPRVAVAGPLISTYQSEALTNEDSPIIKVKSVEESKSLVHRQLKYSPDLIKIWFIVLRGQKPEDHLDIVKAAIDESHKHKVRVAVHATQLETARLAVRAGANVLVHGIEDKEVDQEFINLLKDRNVILTPTLMVMDRYREVILQEVSFTNEELEWANPFTISTLHDLKAISIEDTTKSLINRFRSRLPISKTSIIVKNVKALSDAGITIAMGTDAGNIGTLHGPSVFKEMELMSEAGLTPFQILKCATINGAKLAGWESKVGSIEVGKFADILILNSNPLDNIRNTSDINLIIKNGKLYKPDRVIKKTPEDVVQHYINAYNSRNLEVLLTTYSDNAKHYSHSNVLQISGKINLTKKYKMLFEDSASPYIETVKRRTLGNRVVNHERIRGVTVSQNREQISTYEVTNGVISKVWCASK